MPANVCVFCNEKYDDHCPQLVKQIKELEEKNLSLERQNDKLADNAADLEIALRDAKKKAVNEA